MTLYEDLEWRGLIKDVAGADLKDKLNGEPITFYWGTDPTADSLHIGHYSSLVTAKRLMKVGHKPILLCGGATGRIGDPRPTAEREILDYAVIEENIKYFEEQLKPKNYHVAIGVAYRSMNTNTEEMVKEAEVKMYEAKAKYYQNKEEQFAKNVEAEEYVNINTGIKEIDTMLSVMQEHYSGIYRVSLTSDKASRILMPAYLKYNENEEHFSQLFIKYVNESVDSDHRRSMMAFLNYDAIKEQLEDGRLPKIKYTKNQGETMVLSVYKLNGTADGVDDTLWVFARD